MIIIPEYPNQIESDMQDISILNAYQNRIQILYVEHNGEERLIDIRTGRDYEEIAGDENVARTEDASKYRILLHKAVLIVEKHNLKSGNLFLRLKGYLSKKVSLKSQNDKEHAVREMYEHELEHVQKARERWVLSKVQYGIRFFEDNKSHELIIKPTVRFTVKGSVTSEQMASVADVRRKSTSDYLMEHMK